MIYLYIKTHNKTGLKYLGKTVSKDPYAYRGSGKLWARHIKKHGYDVKTEILFESTDENEIKTVGLFFSRLFCIVESKEWANLMNETGDGGWHLVNELRKTGIIRVLHTTESKEKRKIKIASSHPNFYQDIGKKGNEKFHSLMENDLYKSNYLEIHKKGLPKNHQSGVANSQYGKQFKWMNNKIINKKVELHFISEYLEKGFVLGRIKV